MENLPPDILREIDTKLASDADRIRMYSTCTYMQTIRSLPRTIYHPTIQPIDMQRFATSNLIRFQLIPNGEVFHFYTHSNACFLCHKKTIKTVFYESYRNSIEVNRAVVPNGDKLMELYRVVKYHIGKIIAQYAIHKHNVSYYDIKKNGLMYVVHRCADDLINSAYNKYILNLYNYKLVFV